MDDHRNDDGRDHHEADGQGRDGTEVGPEVADRGEVAGSEEDRRQEQQEDEFRGDGHIRQPGHEAQQEAAEDQQDGERDADLARHGDRQGDHDEQSEDELDGLRLGHVSDGTIGPIPFVRRRCPDLRRWSSAP